MKSFIPFLILGVCAKLVLSTRCREPENNVCPAKNEEFSECVSPCGETCQNLGQDIVCNFLVCNQGCACKPGFYRNGDGSCVPPEECDCGVKSMNQQLYLCHDPTIPEGCDSIGTIFDNDYTEVCKPMCKCKPNFKRNSSGQCIDIRECPQPFQCKDDEVYDACPDYCMDERCVREPRLQCTSVRIAFNVCFPVCRCRTGYCRNDKGECVDKRIYDPIVCTGDHEVYTECGNDSCVRDCKTLGRTDIACRPSCNPGCICEWGYIRNAAGICVRPSQCENNVCPGQNEELSECISPCEETCRNLGHNITCHALVCNLGCVCKSGFFRNGDGSCVAPEKCDCGGEGSNQELDLCHNPCPSERCEDIGKKVKCGVPEVCKPACKCKLNYKRDNSGQCIDIQECPQPFECKSANQEYVACPDCVDESCGVNPMRRCALIKESYHVCIPACGCQKGYCRNNDLECVDRKVYDSCGGDLNAYIPERWQPCSLTCENKDDPSLVRGVCDPYPECACRSGFVKDSTGKCILPENCPKVCPKNEEFSQCVSPCGETCQNLGRNLTCNFLVCKQGCDCKPGFYRNGDGSCVPPEKCDCGGEGSYQELDLCHNPCPPEGCEDIGKMFKCAVPEVCKPACKCKLNYKRNSSGQCVNIFDCPQLFECKGIHEVYSACSNICFDETCGRDSEWRCSPVKPENITCRPACSCQKGYCRNVKGECVDRKIYDSCGGDLKAVVAQPWEPCSPTCDNKDNPVVDLSPCNPYAECRCRTGLVKDLTGKCIMRQDCPCGGEGSNQELDLCYNPCPPEGCEDIGKMFKCAVPEVCKPACKCKLNYKRNSSGQCVDIGKCPQPFECKGIHEVYSAYSNVCFDETCGRDPEWRCSPIRPENITYRPACFCQKGYCRNVKGECVDRKIYDSCGGDLKAVVAQPWEPCSPTCDNKDNPVVDLSPCNPYAECRCRTGLVKDLTGKCIFHLDCQCGVNETFKCGSACDTTCATLGEVCPIVNKNSTLKCYCMDGYARNDKDICILISDCPPCKGDVNADPKCGCKCKKGFMKNKSDKCMPIIRCTDPNSELVSCPNPCPGGTCDSPTFSPCKIKCPEQGCQCKKGFVKKSSIDSICTALKKCPKKKKC